MEMEDNDQLPYLDTLIIKHDNKIKLNWYKKDIASGRMIHFESYHPKQMKHNTAYNFIRRVKNISDECFHEENKIKIRKMYT